MASSGRGAKRWTARHGIFPLLVGRRIFVLAGGTRAGHSQSVLAEILDVGFTRQTESR
jgi:hypothetical protein